MATTSSSSPSRTNSTETMNSSSNNQNVPLGSSEFEEVLLELTRYEKSPTQEIPTILERYLIYVAKTGNANFPWSKVKPLFRMKLEIVISGLTPTDEIPPVPNVDVFNFSAIKNKVFEQLDAFSGIPFTVQRLAELLTAPRRHYKRTDKFMRALEKNMLIVSTVEATANNNGDSSSTSNYFMNGDYITNGNISSNHHHHRHHHESNGSTSPELGSKSPQRDPPTIRDNIEDELDAEVAEVSVPSSGLSVNPAPVTNQIPTSEIEDELVNETDAVVHSFTNFSQTSHEPKPLAQLCSALLKPCFGSSSEEQPTISNQRSDQEEKVSGSEEEENQASQSSDQPSEVFMASEEEEAMHVENNVESSSDASSDLKLAECIDTPITSVTPSSTSESTIESAKEEINSEETTTTTTTNEAAVCSTSEQPQELTEEVTKDEEQVNSSCEALPTIPSPPKTHTPNVKQQLEEVSEPGSTNNDDDEDKTASAAASASPSEDTVQSTD